MDETVIQSSLDHPLSKDLTLRVSPNPFNQTTNIVFQLPEAANVRLSAYNIAGRKVLDINMDGLSAGEHSIKLDGQKLSSGIYFLMLESASQIVKAKMLFLK